MPDEPFTATVIISTGGPSGPPGAAATVTVGSTTTSSPGGNAIVLNSGSSSAAILDFTIPRGATGPQGPQGDPGPSGAGTGDVSGPGASVVADHVVFWDGTSGTLVKDSGLTLSGTNTGDQTITLTGNVTGSGTGSFAATIANDAVTYAKMQNVSTNDRILGRSTAGAGDVEEIVCTSFARSVLDDSDASTVRSTLGLGTLATQSGTFSGTSSGTNTGDQDLSGLQPLDADLTAIAGLTSAADKLPYFTGSGTAAVADFTSAGRALVDDADAAAQRTTLGLAIGTNVQAWDADLDALAALSGTHTIYYRSAANTWSAVTIGTGLDFTGATLSSTASSGTVTNTGGNLTANSVVLGAGTVDTKVVAGIISDGTSKLTLGVAGTSAGGIDFKNATSGTITVAPPTGALGTRTLTLPTETDTLATRGWVQNTGIPTEVSGTGYWYSSAGALQGTVVGVTGTQGSVVQSISPSLTVSLGLAHSALGATSLDGFLIENQTAAVNNGQQVSPRIHYKGFGWDSTNSLSKAVEVQSYVKPVQGAGAPTGQLITEFQIAGSGFNTGVNQMTFDSDGNLTLTGLTASALVLTDSNKKLTSTVPGTGVTTFLATPSSANLRGALTDELGTGAALFDGATPSTGLTLTNCTGLPISGLTASTSTALGVGSVELGHATDTTIARVSAGVISVEGVTVPTISSTSTLTNKRINPRVDDQNAPASPYAADSDSYDMAVLRGISGGLTINAPTGTPVQGQKLIIRFKDDGTARALTWQTGSSGQFRASSDLALPTTTTLSKTLYTGFIYNSTDSRWDLLAKLDNF